MTNYAHGHHAEKVAASYLRQQGYKLYALNWRHRRAEIDIVAGTPHGGTPVFVEVKYRATTAQGNGLDYITPTKLRQMQFAAQLWAAAHGYQGDYTLAAIEISGPSYEVTAFLDAIY
ncbi:MAG TPA: YraN family protein [Candidatus Saccharimonadales bacterium]|nr:YraN family protein [Candidatus Saccharimonadales bacterium]